MHLYYPIAPPRRMRLTSSGGSRCAGVHVCVHAQACLCVYVCVVGLGAIGHQIRLSGRSRPPIMLTKYGSSFDTCTACLPAMLTGVCRIACRAAAYGPDLEWCDEGTAGTLI